MNKLKKITLLIGALCAGIITFSQNNLNDLHQELHDILDNKKYDTSSIKLVKQIFFEVIEIDPLQASEIAAIGCQIADSINDTIIIAGMENLRGISILKQKTYFMASQIFFNNYEIFKKYNNKEDMAQTLLLIARVYLGQGIVDISEDKAMQALSIFEKINDSLGIADTYAVIGLSYLGEDDNKSIKYFYDAKKIYKSYSDEIKLAEVKLFIAKAYYNLEKGDTAIVFINEALNIFKELDEQIKTAQAYEQLADAFFYEQKYGKAEEYYLQAKDILFANGALEKILTVDLKLASTYYRTKKYNEAISIAEAVLKKAKIYDDRMAVVKCFNILSQSYQQLGDLEKAYKFVRLYGKSLIKYYDKKSLGDFSLFQMNLEMENKENEYRVEKMISEREKLQLAQKQYNRTIIFTVIILVLVLILLAFIFIRMRSRKKVANELLNMNKHLKQEIDERKKAEIESKSNEARYELLFSQTPVGILQFDDNLLITNINERFAEIFHKSIKELRKMHLNKIFDRKTVNDISHLFDSKKQIIQVRSEIPTKKEVVSVSLTIKKFKIWIEDEEIVGGMIIIEDFTEHKRAERYYKANILHKRMLVKQIPDDIILLDKNENIIEIHFPNSPEREIGVSKLQDIFKDRTLSIFKTHILNARNSQKTSQFLFSDGNKNFLVRIVPSDQENILIIIARFEGEAQDAGIIIKENSRNIVKSKANYLDNIQDDIEKELLPVYQNIQKGLSFLMIKNFAEKIVTLGKQHHNNKIIDYGEQLLDYVTSFNVFKVNETIEKFPSFISQFMGLDVNF